MALSASNLVGCAPAPIESATQAVQASSAARKLGVGSYVVGDDVVKVLGLGGEYLGTLTVLDNVDRRLLTVQFLDGEELIAEIERPMADGQFRLLAPENRGGLIEADPALAPFFTTHQLHFSLKDQARAKAMPALAPEATAYCSDVTFTTGCTATTCINPYSSGSVASWEIDWSHVGCAATCAGFGYTAVDENQLDGFTDCGCGVIYTEITRLANCPTTHGCSSCDVVSKTRECYEPGSCQNVANGFQYCCGA